MQMETGKQSNTKQDFQTDSYQWHSKPDQDKTSRAKMNRVAKW
jgi:hypothetical protein